MFCFFIKAGGVFVRWGRKDCPGNNTELIYSGKQLDGIGVLAGEDRAIGKSNHAPCETYVCKA